MKTKLYILVAGMLLATVGTGLGQAPVITNDLQNQTTCIGADATFTVGATGAEPLAYQWQKTLDFVNCADLPGCTNVTMVITNVQGMDFVYYHVVIINAEGAATSSWARVDVAAPPTISAYGQPTNFAAACEARRRGSRQRPHRRSWGRNHVGTRGP